MKLKINSSEDRDINTEQVTTKYFIDLDWYQQNNRSFPALAQSRLCPKCWKRLKADRGWIPAVDLLAAFQDCCSKTKGFITDEQPILENVFRFFLANGNQPLDLEELGKQLNKQRRDSRFTSAEILSRLLGNDRYYGLRQVTTEPHIHPPL